MKTFEKVLFEKRYEGIAQYTGKVETKIEFLMFFDFKDGLRFTVRTGNFSSCFRNPFEAFIRTLEHESIGMIKYDHLKERYRKTSTDFTKNRR